MIIKGNPVIFLIGYFFEDYYHTKKRTINYSTSFDKQLFHFSLITKGVSLPYAYLLILLESLF